MSARAARFEVVRSDAGWFARFRAKNGRKVWQTEVYRRQRDAEKAIDLLYIGRQDQEFTWIDEREVTS